MRKMIGIGFMGVGVAALLLGTTPAIAATLPAGDVVYTIPCDANEYNGFLYTVNTTTGVSTRVGSWVNPDDDIFNCAGPSSYNPIDGKGYWISWGPETNLIQVDLTTGVNTAIAQITLDGTDRSIDSMAIDPQGAAYATYSDGGVDTLYSLSLTTGVLTEIGATTIPDDSDTYGLAWDKVTSRLYAYNTGGEDFWIGDTTTGAFALVNDDVFTDVTPYGMAFDSEGQIWGINQDIISAPLADLDDFQVLEVINPYTNGDEGSIYSESILIGPAPALAATGSTTDPRIVVGAGALVLLGGVLLVARRRRTA